MERQKIDPVDFGKSEAKAEPSKLKPFTGKIPELPKKHKVSTMFRFKKKIAAWAVGIIADLPADYFVELIEKVVEKVAEHPSLQKHPFPLIAALLRALIDAVKKDSEGGRMITFNELKKLIDLFEAKKKITG